MKRLMLALPLLLASTTASARRFGMEPQNRVHLGLSMANTSLTLGATGGLDTRLSRVLYVDTGGFFSVTDDTGRHEPAAGTATKDLFELRHALYVAPGLRIPHRYVEGLNWDLTGRVGFGAVWSADSSSDYLVRADPALLGGADLLLRYDRVGLRVGGKAFAYRTFTLSPPREAGIVKPQFFAEGVLQW